jgi:hypothetical protein
MLLFRYYDTPMLYMYKLRRYHVSWCDGVSMRIMCVFLVNVSMNCWCLLEPSSAFTVTRVNSTNVLNEGLRIGEIGRRMNSKVKLVEIDVYRK